MWEETVIEPGTTVAEEVVTVGTLGDGERLAALALGVVRDNMREVPAAMSHRRLVNSTDASL